jgi:adenylosuccinate synthase
MITNTIAFGVVVLILGVTFGLVKIIYDIIIARVKGLENKCENLHDRTKDLEAFNTHKIDQLIKDFGEFKTLVSTKMHKDADFINATKNTIARIEPILNHLEKWQDEHEEMKQKLAQLR